MSGTFNHPTEIERDEEGSHVVAFSDSGWSATDGRRGTRLGIRFAN